jgi:CRISPR-associated endonuclease/helicase Cas3
MSKSERQYPYIFGRVFFPGESVAIPNEIRFQPLGNHVGNVVKLVEYWQKEDFPESGSLKRVKKAGKNHDIGKPQKFELKAETTKQGKFKKYIYSFRGHRFLAESQDAWVTALAKGHHDFSVGDISRDAYELKKDPNYAAILEKDPLAYARELYILEMGDQIEAELACRILGDEEQAESRTFMDYTIAKDDSELNTYRIDPWIFDRESIQLDFKSWVWYLSDDDKAELRNCLAKERPDLLGKTLDKLAKKWWQEQNGKPKDTFSQTATLKPYQSSEDKLQDKDCQFWYQQLGGFAPNPMQQEMWDAIANNPDPAILLKSPTGSGKFESVLFPALANRYRLIIPLPARSLLEDQKQRLEKYLERFSALYPQREISLVIDTGSQMYRCIYRDGKVEPKPRTGNPRRHLYKGDVILTTLDKFLYRYFAFGDKQKSFVFPLRIHRDKTHNEKTLICFDEAHSYDEIAFTNFHSLVQSLYEVGRSLILMTATMPQQYIDRFDYLEAIDYIGISENSVKSQELIDFQKQHLKQDYLNQRSSEWINDIQRNSENPEPFQQRVCETIAKEWKAQSNRRIIAVVQTVKDAVAIYRLLSNELRLTENTEDKQLYLYHGRLDHNVRQEVYTQLKHRDDTAQPYILITTSAIEVGCDLNSEILISEICLPENLIQRAGRCNRKGDVLDAKVIVVGKIEGEIIPFYAQSLNEAEWQSYQETLQELESFDSHKIAEHIARSQQVDDYRVVELFSMLHDYVYGADLTYQPAHEKGLVVTRSWTPSATLVYDDGTKTEIKDMPQVTVPVDRLLVKKDRDTDENKYQNTYVFERYYDQEETRWKPRDLRWGCAYQKDIIVKIGASVDGAFMAESGKKYDYTPELGFVDLPGVFIKLKTSGFEEKLLYQHDGNSKQKSAIITYIKALQEETKP